MTALKDRLKTLNFLGGEFDLDVRKTYFSLRSWIGLIGLLLPFILVGWGLRRGIAWSDMTALSAFYWLSPSADPNIPLRVCFVGSLVAVGMCLIIYRGYGPLENWLLNFAGVALILVAFNPMSWAQPPFQQKDHVHETAAVTFFLMIAFTIFCTAGDTLVNVPPQRQKRWQWIYWGFAAAMVLAPLGAVVLAKANQRTIWAEVAGVWVFSIYWFVKTCELRRVSQLEPVGAPAPHLSRVAGRLQIVRPPEPNARK